MQVQVVENVLKMNDELAAMNRRTLHDAGIVSIDLIGAPGCGKTALLEATLKRLAGERRMAVIVGDMATQRDADRMAKYCDQVVQINTGKGCHLEAHHIRQAIGRLDLARIDLLFIENVGNLICTSQVDTGAAMNLALLSVPEGDDKPLKYPPIFAMADALAVTKADYLDREAFDLEALHGRVAALKPDSRVFAVSARSGEGLAELADFIAARAAAWLGAEPSDAEPPGSQPPCAGV